MKYLKTILITIALLTIYGMQAEESIESLAAALNEPIIQRELTIDEVKNITQPAQETASSETPAQEKTLIEQWNDHLELLKTDTKYWDSTSNSPTSDWKSTAFDLAEKITSQDSSMAETLRTSFRDALNTKTTNFKDIEDLLEELKSKIESKQETTSEVKESVPAPETISAPEPVSEPEQQQLATETPTPESSEQITISDNSTTNISTESLSQDLNTQWKDILQLIKSKEDITASLDKAQEIGRGLLLNGYPPQMLENDLFVALKNRSITQETLDNEMNRFRNGIFYDQMDQFYRSPSQQDIAMRMEMEKLQRELDEKDAKARQEKEEHDRKYNEILAAANKLTEEGKLSEERLRKVHETVRLQQERDALIAEEQAKEFKKIKDAHAALIKNMQQMAATQKPAAEGGVLSNITQAVSNWWYGTTESTTLSADKQDALLDTIVQKTKNPEKAKIAFKEFQRTLLSFNDSESWNEDQITSWIKNMRSLVNTIVITYKIMSSEEIKSLMRDVLKKSAKFSNSTIEMILTKILTDIQAIELDTIKREIQKKTAQEQKAQQLKEKKAQEALAEQKRKDEENKKAAAKKKLVTDQISYRNEKKELHDFLTNIGKNSQATQQETYNYTKQALEKAQSLLRLAHDIPNKDKAVLAHKLKQRFTIALLEQQKINPNSINIYHAMDIFNKGVNKMIE